MTGHDIWITLEVIRDRLLELEWEPEVKAMTPLFDLLEDRLGIVSGTPAVITAWKIQTHASREFQLLCLEFTYQKGRHTGEARSMSMKTGPLSEVSLQELRKLAEIAGVPLPEETLVIHSAPRHPTAYPPGVIPVPAAWYNFLESLVGTRVLILEKKDSLHPQYSRVVIKGPVPGDG
jgi:hypothetical protein